MQGEIEIQTAINYTHIDDNFEDNRGIILVGSTRSTKTICTLQWIINYMLSNMGKHVIIGRDKLATLKDTVLKDFEELCKGSDIYPALYPDLHIKDKNSRPKADIGGCTIEFIGLNDDVNRAHGLKSDIFYINEAVACYKKTFNQLNQRCEEGFILDCNPSEPNSWVYQLDKRDDVKTFRTTFEDNPFLSKSIVDEILSYEPTEENIEAGTADARHWSIYGKGEIYKGKEIVYPEWEKYTDDPEEYDYIFYGLDWGYNDPTAVVQLIIVDRKLYIKELLYASELDYDEIIEVLLQEQPIVEGSTYVVCDSSEPRSINKLIEGGVAAYKAKKGQGSIIQGIRKIQGYKIFIHEQSHNIHNEANNYKFKVDKATDTVLDIPEDKNNHAWDAIRYPINTFL